MVHFINAIGILLFLTHGASANPHCQFELIPPHLQQRTTMEALAGLKKSIAFWHHISLRTLSATGEHRRFISMYIDLYLYMKEINPIVEKFEETMHRVEYYFVTRNRLEQSRNTLITAKNKAEVISIMADLGRLTADRKQRIEEATSPESLKAVVESLANEMAAEIRQHDAIIGTHIDEYLQVRRHLAVIISSDTATLLGLVNRIDSRVSATASIRASAAVIEPAKESIPAPPMTLEQKGRLNITELDEQILQITQLRDALAVSSPTVIPELRDYLRNSGLMNDELGHLLERPIEDTAARNAITNELLKLNRRLGDAKIFIGEALKLNNRFGLHLSDFQRYSGDLGNNNKRPEAKEIELLGYNNPDVEWARLQQSLRQQRKNSIITWLLFGKVFDSVASVAKGISNTGHRTGLPAIPAVLDWFFRDLADLQVRQHYYPHLMILQRLEGSADKKLDILRRLNAMTPGDELLITLARRVDMLELWNQLKAVAKPEVEGYDHFGFYNRMLEAEKKARQIGELTPLDESGYLTRIGITSLRLGSLSLAGLAAKSGFSQLLGWFNNGAVLPNSNNEPDNSDDDSKKKDVIDDLSRVGENMEAIAAGETPDLSILEKTERIHSIVTQILNQN